MTSDATDLAVSIMGNASSVGIGDTVHLIISLSNLGPKSCDAKLNYKIPVGLKLLSSQGPGVYDVASGVWDVGLLSVSDSVSLDLVLQAVNIGYFVNMVSVYGDLTSTHASVFKPIVKVFNGKWRSTAAMSDSNNRNNKASFSFDVKYPNYQTPSHEYKWPDVPDPTPNPQPTPTPKPDQEPQPTPQPDIEPPWDPQPTVSNDQLPRDIRSIRDVVSGVKDAKIADWNPDLGKPKDENADNMEYLSVLTDLVIDVIFLGSMATTPGSGEYLQQVKNGIVETGNALKMAASYFSKDPKYAFRILKDSLRGVGQTESQIKFLDDLSKRVFALDPNIAQEALKRVLCIIFPNQSGKIAFLISLVGSVNFLLHPAEILKAWGDLAYSFAVDGVNQGDYEKVNEKFWDAFKETFTKPL
ncbi:MAG: DUF11 domain-containing protein [Methanobacteriaceae archaeon]|nr:DUF11 domain-containing protein [Methanobacteriaceae archaeon]